MIEHTINREIFDFHYESEKVAEKMQKQLVNYYAYEFNQIIQRVIEQEFPYNEFYFCDKLEIDLGDIEEDAFEAKEVFEKFEEALMQRLNQLKNSPQAQVSYEKIAEEVVQQFLLKGDVPWWINKSSDTVAIQPFVRLLISRAPEKLIAIIKQNQETALIRLTALFSESRNNDVADFKSFLEAVKKEGLSIERSDFQASATAGLQKYQHDETMLIKGNKITLYLNELEPGELQKMQKILHKDTDSHSSTEKELIIAAVMKRKRLLSAIKEITLFTNQETIKAITRLLQKQRLSAAADEKLRTYLLTFSVYALHWLHAETLRMQAATGTHHNDENEAAIAGKRTQVTSGDIESGELEESSPQVSNDIPANDEKHIAEREQQEEQVPEPTKFRKNNDLPTETFNRKEVVIYLLEKLKLKQASAAIFDSYSDSDIRELAASFNKIEKDAAGKKTLATFLLEHPYFFKFSFLKIIIEGFAKPPVEKQHNKSLHPTSEKSDNAKVTDALFLELDALYRKSATVFQKLSENELLILQDVLQRESITTKREHQAIQKVLQQMPVKLLVLLQAFTMLKESDITNILAQPAAKERTMDVVGKSSQPDYFQQQPEQKKIQINNAGICLIAAYLPAFFRNMHLLEDKKFKSISHAMQAMYLIAYLAEGGTRHKEYLLQFNKILTGFGVTDPVPHMPRLPSGYRKEADALLAAIIDNWKALRTTSITGFRQSFLKRDGLLTDNGPTWTLQVERKGHDVLLGSVPWGFSMIRFPWMQKPVVVEW